MGGFIAALFAATYPQMVASVWLLDAAGTEASHDTPLMRRYEQTGEMPLLLRQAGQFDQLLAATTHKTPFVPRFVRTTLGRRGAADYALHTEILRQLASSPLLETQYHDLATPAFIVWGEHDQILHLNGAKAFKALFPAAQVRIMEGIGHLPMAESPRQAAQDYLAFRQSLTS
jgi:triacylglycerol lipase